MSHFITAVITKNPHKYEEELAPYQENNEGDCPREFMEFVDRTEKLKDVYENKTTERVKLPDGSYIYTSSEKIKVCITEEEYNKKNGLPKGCSHHDGETYYYEYDPSVVGGKVVQVPYKELFKDFKEFAIAYEGEHIYDEEMQSYGYWENPNAKWDYYSLCAKGNYGRWQRPSIEDAFVKVKDYKLYNDRQELINEYNKAKEAAENSKETIEKFSFAWNYGKYKDAEDYADKNIITAPWAFVLDKKWAERGEMGWWAMSDATDESEDAFKKLFEKIMTDEKYQDYYIGFVNCHI